MAKRKRGSFQQQETPDFGLGATLAYLKGEDTIMAGAAASKDDDEGWTVVVGRPAKKRLEKQPRDKDYNGHDRKQEWRERGRDDALKRARRRSPSPHRSHSPDSPRDEEEEAGSKSDDASAKAPLIFGGNPFAPKNGDSDEHLSQPSNPFSAPGKAAKQAKETLEDIAKRQEARGKARKLERHYPVIKHSHNARLNGSVKISDLQSLALYILADGTAPQWVAVENRSHIRKVVMLMVPGLEMAMFNGKLPLESDRVDENSSKPKGLDVKHDDYYPASLKPDRLSDSLKPLVDVFPHVWPIMGPSESRGKNHIRLHSPMHAILSSQVPKTQEEKQLKKSGKHKGPLPQGAKHWQNQRTPIIEYLTSLADQQENEYVVHPAWFTTDEAKEAAQQRRKDTHSTAEDGWVDSHVARLEDGDVPDKDIEQGSVTAGRRVLAVDCEMCKDENDVSVLTRISLIDWDGTVVMDKLVKPDTPIKDYVTQWSGITEEMLRDVTTTLSDIQKELLDILTPHTILVGHSLNSDLNAIKITHPFLVDTGILFPHIKGPPFKQSLKWLAQKFLRKDIQKGTEGHDSVEDARTCLNLVKQKCERGPRWGTGDTNAESIFKRFERVIRPKSNDEHRAGAMVDWGNPNQGPGAQAKVAIGCDSDAEIVAGIEHALSGLAVGKNGTTGQVDFVFARLRELELVRGWWDDGRASDESKARRQAALARLGLPPDWDAEISNEALGKEVAKTVDNIVRIYKALPPCTAFIVYSGTGDPREVRRLRQLQDQHKEEYRSKKWDEITQWGSAEDEQLSRAVKKARNGVGFMTIK
ncbi:hypothetical protein BU23DRAFT_231902 [Bimuria novae-zelandiae CBS 107.79]|uniref:Exonuclease domain-containing protein n=1 Tax=Bimuria novae-zelandiae CBS 107.79 TaxID=1447943 RepID=A0A6A5UZ49_9PLEO|nr:hypothetical protein BU23DRAFT_231902 [Bimuria novae-zelandiae CBS 107.79]